MTPDGAKAAGRGVTLCGWTQIAKQSVRLVRLDDEKPRTFYRGLQACGLRWVCPCCTIKKSEASRGDLNAALAVARGIGLVPVMLTLTARHTRKTSLSQFWGMLSDAEKAMKRTRSWKKLNGRLAGGFAKAVEITHSLRNGWHPHFHLVMMTDAADEAQAIELVEELRSEWLHQLDRVGLDGTSKAAERYAFDVRGAKQAGDYITKWGAAEELTLSGRKVGRAEGRNPWQLLRDARTASTDDERTSSGALWWEFVQVMKGVHQLRQSAKFRALVALYVPDEADAGEDPEEHTIFRFDDPVWTHARHKRLLMKEAAEECSVQDAPNAVKEVLLGEKFDRDLWQEDEISGHVIEETDDREVCSARRAHNGQTAHAGTGRKDSGGVEIKDFESVERWEAARNSGQRSALDDLRGRPPFMDGCAEVRAACTDCTVQSRDGGEDCGTTSRGEATT